MEVSWSAMDRKLLQKFWSNKPDLYANAARISDRVLVMNRGVHLVRFNLSSLSALDCEWEDLGGGGRCRRCLVQDSGHTFASLAAASLENQAPTLFPWQLCDRSYHTPKSSLRASHSAALHCIADTQMWPQASTFKSGVLGFFVHIIAHVRPAAR